MCIPCRQNYWSSHKQPESTTRRQLSFIVSWKLNYPFNGLYKVLSAEGKVINCSICLEATFVSVKFNKVHIASRMLNYTHPIRAVASCTSSVCCLGLQFQGKTSCNSGKLWLDTTPGTAFHVMSLCVKAPTKRPSVSFCCCHFRALDGCHRFGYEPLKSNRCFQLYNRLWKLPLVFFFLFVNP